MQFPVTGQQGDGNFQDDGIDVEAGHVIRRKVFRIVGILSIREHARDPYPGRAGTEIERIEGRSQVNVEGIVHGASEHSHAVAEIVDALARQVRIIRHGAGADIGRHGKQESSPADSSVLLSFLIMVTV